METRKKIEVVAAVILQDVSSSPPNAGMANGRTGGSFRVVRLNQGKLPRRL